jgi:accessory gene regulator B
MKPMKLKETLSNWVIAQIRSQNPDISDTKVAELEYGFLAFYLTVTKFIVILALAWALQIIPVMLIVTVTFMFVRTCAGGVHAESSLMCLITTSIIYFGVALCAIHTQIPRNVLIGMAGLAIILITTYAPADNSNKPIRGPKHRRKLKTLSIVFTIVFTIISFFVTPVLQSAIILSIFVESLMITPIAYRLTKTQGGEHYEKTIK